MLYENFGFLYRTFLCRPFQRNGHIYTNRQQMQKFTVIVNVLHALPGEPYVHFVLLQAEGKGSYFLVIGIIIPKNKVKALVCDSVHRS